MSRVTLGEAFVLNPTVKLSKGTHAPFVDLASLAPFTRDVSAAQEKPYGGGMKFCDGDVLMARITPSLENGKTSVYRAAADQRNVPAFGSTEFIVIRGREGTSSSSFAYYLFTSPEVRDYAISSMNGSSGRQRVQIDSLASFEIDLPELKEQRAIAATLGALDDKIESNRRAIALIPQLVRARVDASLSQASDRIAVAELARFVNGGAYTKGATGTGRMVIRIAELNSGPGGSTVYNDKDVPDEKTARAGDILMSWSGSLGVYRWFRDEAIVNQHIFKVISTDYPAWLVFDRLDAVMPVFRGVAADKATTMGHIQRGHLESTNVEIPVVLEIEQLNEILSPLWERLLSAEREVVRLTKLRDALLPELLSGRIRVPAEGVAA